jgi:hypothetical protein
MMDAITEIGAIAGLVTQLKTIQSAASGVQ